MLFQHNLNPDEERHRFMQWHSLSTGVSIMLGVGFGSIMATFFGFTLEIVAISVCFAGLSYLLFAFIRFDLALSFFDSEWHECRKNRRQSLKENAQIK